MKILKTCILLLLLMLAAVSLAAQNITTGEYYFDTDPGQGNGQSLSLAEINGTYTYSGSINTSALSVGIHMLYIRALNEDKEWGLPSEYLIYVNAETGSKAETLEYFYAEEPGPGKGSSLSLNVGESEELERQAELSTSELTPGIHRLGIRVGNGEGIWGMPLESLIYINRTTPDGSAVLTTAEYFTESDSGFGQANALNLNRNGDEYTAEFAVSGEGFSVGEQQLFVRAVDENSVWGMYAPSTFLSAEVPNLNFENTDTLHYEMNSGLLFFAENLIVSSETDITADSAMIQLTEGYLPEEDSLGVEDGGSLEVKSGPGWIKIRGNDDLDDYEGVLQTVYLTALEAESYTDTLKRFEIKIWNGAFASDSVVKYVSVSYLDTTATSVEKPGEFPVSYSLSPNYPNPFNPVTSVRFSLPEPAEVKLTVFNMLGQEVAVLINEKRNPGWYTVQINANSWASGFYIYQLRAGSFLKTGKMTLIK